VCFGKLIGVFSHRRREKGQRLSFGVWHGTYLLGHISRDISGYRKGIERSERGSRSFRKGAMQGR
jgi:hypothetical protein